MKLLEIHVCDNIVANEALQPNWKEFLSGSPFSPALTELFMWFFPQMQLSGFGGSDLRSEDAARVIQAHT